MFTIISQQRVLHHVGSRGSVLECSATQYCASEESPKIGKLVWQPTCPANDTERQERSDSLNIASSHEQKNRLNTPTRQHHTLSLPLSITNSAQEMATSKLANPSDASLGHTKGGNPHKRPLSNQKEGTCPVKSCQHSFRHRLEFSFFSLSSRYILK